MSDEIDNPMGVDEAADNPLTEVRLLFVTALSYDAGIREIIPPQNFQVWDRKLETGQNFAEMASLGRRLWLVPARHTMEMHPSNTAIRYIRRFVIGYGSGDMELAECERLEWLISRALAPLKQLRLPPNPVGKAPTPWPDEALYPLIVEWIGAGEFDPQKQPLEFPEEWTGVADVEAVAKGPLALIERTLGV